jgi:hypothetical protein
MNPFFDASRLSEDELTQKINELQSKLVWATRVYYNQDMIRQFNSYLDQLMFERDERYRKDIFSQQQKDFPKIIETDPDMKESSESDSSGKPMIAKKNNRQGEFTGSNRPSIIKKYVNKDTK